jgi:bla regulator protein blaR1
MGVTKLKHVEVPGRQTMTERLAHKLDRSRKLLLLAAACISAAVPTTFGQSNASQPYVQGVSQAPMVQGKVPEWQTVAGAKMAFDVASVRQSTPDAPFKENVALDALDAFPPNGGLFTANSGLSNYIIFAYKIVDTSQYQSLTAQLPKWAQTNKFTIEARADGRPSKDQMRLMMQSLLADRFKLVIHVESRHLPVYALIVDKPGKLGPLLKAHPDDVPCPTAPSPHPSGPAPAPFCHALQMWPVDSRWHARMMALTMEQIADHLVTPIGTGWGGLESRPALDQTGISGRFDFDIEFTPQPNGPTRPAAEAQPEAFGPGFSEALKNQLGLKLVKQTGPVNVFVVDHIEMPSPN